MSNINSPIELWQDFDSSALPLDVNIAATKITDQYTIQHIYFTGTSTDNGCIRVYGVVVKNNQKCTNGLALLLINDLNKGIDIQELKYWADRGRVAMSIDYLGQGEGIHTVYPQSMQYLVNAHKHQQTTSPKQSCWYQYSAMTMRAIEYLRSRDDVQHLSLMSIANGSNIAMIVLGIDNRIDNGALIFGNLYYESNIKSSQTVDEDNDQDNDEDNQQPINTAITDIGHTTLLLAGQNYLPLIKVPIYVVATGNSNVSDIVSLSDTYFRTSEHSRLLIIPDGYDYMQDNVVEGIDRWLQGTTVSEDIDLTYDNKDGVLTIYANTGIELQQLQLWYCRNGQHKGKHWCSTTLQPTDIVNRYSATINLYSNNCTVLAVVVAQDIVNVSSTILSIDIDSSYKIGHSTALIYRGGDNFHFVNFANNHWHGIDAGVCTKIGYLDIEGIEGNAFGTFAIHDDKYSYHESDAMAFDISCNTQQTLRVVAVENFGCDNKTLYQATVPLVGDGKWQRITIDKSHFSRVGDGHSMGKDSTVDLFVFLADQPFMLNNLCVI